jgi:hypothetical protein
MTKKPAIIKCLSVFLASLFMFFISPLTVFADEAESSVTHALIITSESLSVTVGKTIKMSATVSNVDSQPEIIWRSSDLTIATVDASGTVKGLAQGKVTITANATVGDEAISGEFTINVVKTSNFLRDFLQNNQVLSYQYSYVDDYYYTVNEGAWQTNFGFGRIYDIASPYILLEYDYVRVFFTYDNMDWMLQMWKGQYGLIFYGGEVGIYNREHSEDGVSEWAMYNCPGEEDWLGMEMTLWHEEINGKWTREFTREYDKYWWCTGFKNGTLRQQEPADELRLEGRITFKDAEMAKIVADGLKECGFGTVSSKDNLGLDQIYVDGADIYYKWQNISDAESTMFIKTSVGILSAMTTMTLFPLYMPLIVMCLGTFGMACVFVSVLL